MFYRDFILKNESRLLGVLNTPGVGNALRYALGIENQYLPITRVTPTAINFWLSPTKRITHAYVANSNHFGRNLHDAYGDIFKMLHWWDKRVANRWVPALNVGLDTYSEQPDGTAGVDTMIVLNAPTTNYGTFNEIDIGELNNAPNNPYRALIQFDFSSIEGVASSATFSLWMFGTDFADNAGTLSWYRMKTDWVETQATWNIRKTATNWTAAGGFDADDCEQTAIVSRSTTASEAAGEKQWTAWDLTLLSAMFGASPSFTNNGVLGKQVTELNDGYQFRPSDWTTASQRPKMVIEWSAYSSSGGLLVWFGF